METTDQAGGASIVCSLSGPERAVRSLEWTDLGDLSLTTERIEGGVALTLPALLGERIEDLVARESKCCGSWLDIVTSRDGDVIRLELTTTNPQGLALIGSMAGLES